MNISIIGSGYVGFGLGKALKDFADVIFCDVNEKRVEELRERGLNATKDIGHAVNNSFVSFVCVPTPTIDGKIDLSCIKSVSEEIGKALKNKGEYHLVVVKSTVIPGTSDSTVIPIIERFSGKKVNRDFGVCMNPEFLTEIHNSWTNGDEFLRTPQTEERIVIGESGKGAGDLLENLYNPLNKPIFRTDLKTAEFIKYASNCCLASRISFWNEMFLICEKFGIDSNYVAKVVGLDKRIGTYGTVHGKAFGGKCLPKDLKAFIGFSKSIGCNPILLNAVDEINEKMKRDYGVRE